MLRLKNQLRHGLENGSQQNPAVRRNPSGVDLEVDVVDQPHVSDPGRHCEERIGVVISNDEILVTDRVM